MRYVTTLILTIFLLSACKTSLEADPIAKKSHLKFLSEKRQDSDSKIIKSDTYWREALTNSQYKVCRKGGTERAYSGHYLDDKRSGDFICSSCGTKLFTSKHKYDSGSGWPSFFDLPSPEALKLKEDRSFGMRRTEVKCATCDAHLGHVFNDGPKPTGKRYCINSVCLLHEQDLPK